MKQIILPTDFSENAWKAMCYAAELYHDVPCKFYILNTYALSSVYPENGAVVPDKSSGIESEEKLEGLLLQFKDLDHHDLTEFETKSSHGALIDALIDLEDEVGSPKVIVMGTRGVTGLGDFIFGSMTTTAINKCSSPIICVPNVAELSSPNNVLFAIDDLLISSKSEVNTLIEIANNWNSDVTTIHVDENKSNESEKSIKEIVSGHYLKGVRHSFYKTIVGSNVEDEITSYAKENEIDLIALIKRDKGFWQSFFQSSLTKNMALYSKFPLLVLREQ